MMRRRKKNKKSSSVLRKAELIYPKRWTTQAHQRWTKRKLAMSQGEIMRKRFPTTRLKFQKGKVIFGGKIQKMLMFKIQKVRAQ
jgi:hypothetical protein